MTWLWKACVFVCECWRQRRRRGRGRGRQRSAEQWEGKLDLFWCPTWQFSLTKEMMMFTSWILIHLYACCDVFYHWANKNASHYLSNNARRVYRGMMGDCFHRRAGSDFPEARRPFLITTLSQEDPAVITPTIDVFPPLIYSYCAQTLYRVNFSSHADLFSSRTCNFRLIQYMENQWNRMRRSKLKLVIVILIQGKNE